MLQRIILKITSARFLITIILTIVFALLVMNGVPPTEFTTIYGMIITYYFAKDRNVSRETKSKDDE